MALKVVTQKEIEKKRYKKLKFNRKYLIAGLVILILSFFINIVPFIFVGIFMVLNCILLSMDRYISLPVDLEFSTFAAVLCTRAYGFQWGLYAGVGTKIAAMAYNANIRADHFFMMFGYAFAAFLTSIAPDSISVGIIGIIATTLVNIYIVFVSKYITNLYPFEIFMYGMSNFIFNLLLFVSFSGPIFTMMMF